MKFEDEDFYMSAYVNPPEEDVAVDEKKDYRKIINPPHYKMGDIEAIDVIEEFDLGFNLGNVIKYTLRCYRKGDPLENILKAMWYLERELLTRKGISNEYK